MTISNKITISRMIIIPVMIIILFIEPLTKIETIFNLNLAELIFGIFFVLAALTDILDGQLARRRNEVTDFGKFLDPIADKLLTTTALLYIAASRTEHTWWWVLILLIISREFIVSAIRMTAAKNDIVIAASIYGKLKTTITMIAIVAILFNNFGLYYLIGEDAATIVTDILFYVSVLATVLSGLDYAFKYAKTIKAKNKEE
ncbi:MAG TPA: CDP-diacylglycerol--glycerol-3-phosphate 3-phosphatidyltransferase [Acholeplasma sp.]|jgi:CDP-diacylglycerol--glycerol-3-phosphate 3-phosphatidyltransferase|nr:CDP-diacylglycerol--glycerol-3-phosphate 3-phosphatidyltransferase [Acholeplasma sp.]